MSKIKLDRTKTAGSAADGRKTCVTKIGTYKIPVELDLVKLQESKEDESARNLVGSPKATKS